MLSVKRDKSVKDGPGPAQPWPEDAKKLGVEICLLPNSDADWEEDGVGDAEEPSVQEGIPIALAEVVLDAVGEGDAASSGHDVAGHGDDGGGRGGDSDGRGTIVVNGAVVGEVPAVIRADISTGESGGGSGVPASSSPSSSSSSSSPSSSSGEDPANSSVS